MVYRTGLDIKKEIIEHLKKGSHVISQLERKMNTSDRVLKRHLKELEYLGIVKLVRYKKSKKTGRPYTEVRIL